MKNFILALFFTFTSVAFAQITINNSSFPANGTNKTYYAFDTTGLTLSATGANHTWTFTGASNTDVNTYIKYSFMSPTSTPYPTFQPYSNKSFKKITKNSLYNDSIYAYFNNHTDSLTLLGYKEVGMNRSHVFSNPEKQITYPFTHPNTMNDANKKIINSAVNSTGSMNTTVDGYGTLTIGTQTYTNVVRIKVVETDVRPMTGYTESYFTTRYIWCNNSFVDPLVIVEYVTTKFETSTTTSYQRTNNAYVRYDALTGMNDIAKNTINFIVFPSPASNLITLVSNSKKGTIDIINNIGEVVSQYELNAEQTQINIEALPTGIYSVAVSTSEGRAVKKFVKVN